MCRMLELFRVAALKSEDVQDLTVQLAHIAKYAKLLFEQVRFWSGLAKWRALSAQFALLVDLCDGRHLNAVYHSSLYQTCDSYVKF